MPAHTYIPQGWFLRSHHTPSIVVAFETRQGLRKAKGVVQTTALVVVG